MTLLAGVLGTVACVALCAGLTQERKAAVPLVRVGEVPAAPVIPSPGSVGVPDAAANANALPEDQRWRTSTPLFQDEVHTRVQNLLTDCGLPEHPVVCEKDLCVFGSESSSWLNYSKRVLRRPMNLVEWGLTAQSGGSVESSCRRAARRIGYAPLVLEGAEGFRCHFLVRELYAREVMTTERLEALCDRVLDGG